MSTTRSEVQFLSNRWAHSDDQVDKGAKLTRRPESPSASKKAAAAFEARFFLGATTLLEEEVEAAGGSFNRTDSDIVNGIN
jgi:hypothetical protein